MNLHEFEAYARTAIPVPTGCIIATQSIHKSSATAQASIKWSVTHFVPEIFYQCTIGQGETPEAALSHLITQLTTPCELSAPSDCTTTPPSPDSGTPSSPEQPAGVFAITLPAVG